MQTALLFLGLLLWGGVPDPGPSLLPTTYWVSPTGSDTGSCLESNPCKTVNFVLDQKAGDGDHIILQPGIYREKIDIPFKDLTLEGNGQGVFIYGSLVPDLIPSEGLYRADWSWGTSYAGTNFCQNLTNDVSLTSDACTTRGFWQDEVRLEQVYTKANVVAGTFYYDQAAEEVWLSPVAGNTDISGIEGLAHEYVVSLTTGSERVTLKNIQIWYGASKPDDGILRVEGVGHLLEDVGVRFSAGAGILVYGADQVSIDNVDARDHGQNGWRIQADASFSTSTGWTINDWVDDLNVTSSSSRYNGWKGFDNCWGGGGTKFSFTKNLAINGFYSADNNGFGIWLDIENHNYSVEQSMSARDAGRGIFVEYISDDGVVFNNVIYGTKDADAIGCGISVGLAAADSRNVVLSNNTVYSTEPDVKGIMLKTGCPTCRSFPYESEFITWQDNLIVNKDDVGFVRDLDAGSTEPFTYSGTAVEQEFSGDTSTYTCWDSLGNCSAGSLGIETQAPGIYLADESSECGFDVVNGAVSGKGAQGFAHPRAVDVCGVPDVAEPPNASFTYATSFLNVDFTDTSTDDAAIVSWDWGFGDGSGSALQHPSHTYAAAGTYTVTLDVIDADGLDDTFSQVLTVEEEDPVPDPIPPSAAFNVSVSGFTATFEDTSTDDQSIESWQWEFGDSGVSEQQHPSHTYASAGTYSVQLTVTDNEGLSDAEIMDVTIVEDPIPEPEPPTAVFSAAVDRLTVSFTDESTDDGSIEAWLWDLGDGVTLNEQHPVHTYASSGTYMVALTVTDNEGLTDTASQEITVEAEETELEAPQADFNVAVAGLNVSFIDASVDDGSITSWMWDFGDGESSTLQNPSHAYEAPGEYVVSLTVTDDDGLTDSESQTLQLEALSESGGFVEVDGLVVFEAENFESSESNLLTGDEWVNMLVNLDGTYVSMMQALPDDGDVIRADHRVDNARLTFPLIISETGTYYVWLRVWGMPRASSVYGGTAGLDNAMGLGARDVPSTEWVWINAEKSSDRAQVVFPSGGSHDFSIWMREDGFRIDRVLLTTDAGYVPSGVGPDESPRQEASISETNKSAPNRIEIAPPPVVSAFRLVGHYPEPARNRATLHLDLPEIAQVQVKLYDVLGREVHRLAPRTMEKGPNQELSLELGDISTGNYMYKVEAVTASSKNVAVGRLVVLR